MSSPQFFGVDEVVVVGIELLVHARHTLRGALRLDLELDLLETRQMVGSNSERDRRPGTLGVE